MVLGKIIKSMSIEHIFSQNLSAVQCNAKEQSNVNTTNPLIPIVCQEDKPVDISHYLFCVQDPQPPRNIHKLATDYYF